MRPRLKSVSVAEPLGWRFAPLPPVSMSLPRVPWLYAGLTPSPPPPPAFFSPIRLIRHTHTPPVGCPYSQAACVALPRLGGGSGGGLLGAVSVGSSCFAAARGGD